MLVPAQELIRVAAQVQFSEAKSLTRRGFRQINDIAETALVRSAVIASFGDSQLRYQLSLLKPGLKIHGGATCSGNPRGKRPLSTRLPIHLVMRSSRAHGGRSFLRKENAVRIERIVSKHAKLNGVKIYRFANAGNHLHFLVKIANQELFKRFLRVLSGLIARVVLKAEKGAAKLKGVKFWDARPFTRVAAWGKAFDVLCSYLALNQWEALGFLKHTKRDGKRKLFIVKFDPEPPPRVSKHQLSMV